MKIIACDPGRTNDPMGIVGIETDGDNIHVRLAVQLINVSFGKAAKVLRKIKNKTNPDVMAIETNNYGGKLKRLFAEKYGLPMAGINTAASSSSAHTLSKPAVIQLIAKMLRQNRIRFPGTASPDMQELMLQLTEYAAMKTPNGSTSYKRPKGRHDDLVSALLICVHIAQKAYEDGGSSL